MLAEFVDPDRHDVLVLGRTGSGGGPGFLHLGSVVEHAAHHATCPLVVVPAGQVGEVARIVLGVDGSDASASAVRWCADLAAALGATVDTVTVAEPFAEWTPSWDEANWRRDAERHLADWTRPLAAAGVEGDLLNIEDLHPADALVGVASARHADLLVIGTRGGGGFSGLRFGGIAMKVLHRSQTPLALVP